MESFFRYISYVDYYKNGERVKNAGFLRWKLLNGGHQIELQLKDLNCPRGNYEIEEKNTGKVIGNVIMDKGIGSFLKKYPAISASDEMYLDLLNDRLYLSDVEGFIIRLNTNEYLSVAVELPKEKKGKELIKDQKVQILSSKSNIINEKSQDTKAASENVLLEGIEEKYAEPIYLKRESDEIFLDNKEKNSQSVIKKEIEYGKKEQLNFQKERQIEKKICMDKNIKFIEPVHEDKWQQLCRKYPNVHPFPNNKIFLSIKPDDFIILQQEYQKLVHNSFLLHGFYNYGHMILGKLSEEKDAPVYVGIPGVYYEQEKKAAQMFGFVGFESTEHPVQAGSYGYYMIEVEI